ncbi:cytochrome bc1 complex diheme cytochrome c subunit [Fodinicola feengrottensis]|uniref:cytochrome bc1 complex diheme cytochrome c subunit n=1 Tax=Fodinicola feengrottensis TaxID=435914 RepID=UPI002441AD50|nr:cytochrome c [Fodinicola feengrottensis]
MAPRSTSRSPRAGCHWPLAGQAAQAARKPPKFTDDQITQLVAYVQSYGGPEVPTGQLSSTDKDTIAEGGRLFRLNCAACHAFSTKGGALSSGKTAPNLNDATDKQIYEAMLTGPENMPVFANNQLTPDEKKAILSYVQAQKADMDQGGFGIGRSGPVPEGLVIFVIGIIALLFVTLWIAGKS